MAIETNALTGVIDIDSDSAPTVERDRLYRLWEEGNWSAKALDFTRDAVDWREKLTDQQRQAVNWNYSMFLDGEESVTSTLAPFMEALTSYEDRVFLATQIADEARHHVFFDRFIREVMGIGQGDLASTLAATRPNLSWGYTQIFSELDRVADRLRRHPRNLPLLAQGFAIYHLTVEAMLAHTGQHFLRDYGTHNDLFPGFTTGINFVARDETRHIAFGIQALRELVTQHPECKAAAIEMFNRILPWASGVFTPPGMDWEYITCLGYTPQEVFTFGIRSIETKMRRAGIDPSEVRELVKLGYADPPAQQAERVITLIEGGVLGTNATPQPTEITLDALFAATERLAAWTQASKPSTPATIQWQFSDAAPRYLELRGDTAPQAGTGLAEHPALTLRSTAADWVQISTGRLSQTQAVVSRRLRIAGDWGLALRLPQILPV